MTHAQSASFDGTDTVSDVKKLRRQVLSVLDKDTVAIASSITDSLTACLNDYQSLPEETQRIFEGFMKEIQPCIPDSINSLILIFETLATFHHRVDENGDIIKK